MSHNPGAFNCLRSSDEFTSWSGMEVPFAANAVVGKAEILGQQQQLLGTR